MTVWPLQKDCDAFYGNPRGAGGDYSRKWAQAHLTHVMCPWHLKMGTLSVPYITINKACAESLERILAACWDTAKHDPAVIAAEHLDQFSGSFNYRPKRGMTSLSMHAYGAAIDWDAPHNAQHAVKHFFTENSLMVQKFKAEGWIWGGNWQGESIDAMHVQAARIR